MHDMETQNRQIISKGKKIELESLDLFLPLNITNNNSQLLKFLTAQIFI